MIDRYEENKPEGTVENRGSRPIYLVLSDKDLDYRDSDYIRALHSGSTYTGYVDGVVDLVGKVVCNKGESAGLIFTGENKFDRQHSNTENFEGFVKKLGFGDSLPYGLYYGREQDGELVFFYRDTDKIGEAMKSWYDMVLDKFKTGV